MSHDNNETKFKPLKYLERDLQFFSVNVVVVLAVIVIHSENPTFPHLALTIKSAWDYQFLNHIWLSNKCISMRSFFFSVNSNRKMHWCFDRNRISIVKRREKSVISMSSDEENNKKCYLRSCFVTFRLTASVCEIERELLPASNHSNSIYIMVEGC